MTMDDPQASFDNQDPSLTELADGTLAGPEWDQWLADHPEEAAEVAIARQVRVLVAVLQEQSIEVPIDFEARLLRRIRQDSTVRDLLDLSLSGVGRAMLEILALIFSFVPTPSEQQAPATGNAV